jgi:hypothetical protein
MTPTDRARELAERIEPIFFDRETYGSGGYERSISKAASMIEAALQREREEADRDLLDAAEAYQNLAMCYRLGKTPSDKVFEQLEKARETITKARAVVLGDKGKA